MLLNPRPGDSAINRLLSITHSVFEAFDCNPTLEVRSVYLDFPKAFDRVWHDGLIYKLRRCGISGNLLLLLRSFLSSRKQRTVLNGQSSGCGNISAGVPQGSILGPLFFLIYINELSQNLRCNVKLFADDTSFFTPRGAFSRYAYGGGGQSKKFSGNPKISFQFHCNPNISPYFILRNQ